MINKKPELLDTIYTVCLTFNGDPKGFSGVLLAFPFQEASNARFSCVLDAKGVLNHPEQIIDDNKVQIQNYEAWLAEKKVINFDVSVLRFVDSKNE